MDGRTEWANVLAAIHSALAVEYGRDLDESQYEQAAKRRDAWKDIEARVLRIGLAQDW